MKRSVAAFFFLLVSCLSQAQSSDTTKLIDNFFSSWNSATPGGAVLVLRGDQIIYNKAFGIADLEHNTPNTVESIFECGSVSKQFTAASLLLLVAEGKVSLNDDVRKYIPELPTYDAPIRLQNLLNHTSGIKDWGSLFWISGWPRGTRAYTQELSLEIICKQKSLNFSPGAEYSYSNSNYVLLVFIIERISQQSFIEFTRTRLFEPLQMTNTHWRSDFHSIVPNRSIAYSSDGKEYQQDMPFEHVHGPGGLLTTTADLAKWNAMLANHKLGGDALFALRTQRGKLNNGTTINYAGGISVGSLSGFEEISHSGATAGYRAWLAYYPKKKLSVILLSNDGNFSTGAGQSIARLFLGSPDVKKQEPATIPVAENELKKFAGIYRSTRGFDLQKLEYKNGKIASNDHELRAVHADTLYLDGVRWIYVNKNIIRIKYSQDTISYRRVSAWDPKSQASLVGEYISDEVDARYRVDIKNNEVWIHRKAGDALMVTPAFKDGYYDESAQLYEFKRDRKGNVSGLEISIGRARRVPFVKTLKPVR